MTPEQAELDARFAEGQPLVLSLASRIHHSIPVPFDFEDLVAWGQIGLAEAVRDFDPDRGCQFATFAFYRIRGAIYDGVSKMGWTSRAWLRKRRTEALSRAALQEDESQGDSTAPSLAESSRWFRNATDRLAVVYLASQSDEGEERLTVVDPSPAPATLLASREIAEKLRALVEKLPVLEGQLIRAVYFEGTSLQEAADRIGVSKSWASRLHVKALEQLAVNLRRLGESGD